MMRSARLLVCRQVWQQVLLCWGALLLPLIAQAQPEEDVLRGAFWKQQGLSEILPAWTHHARDTTHGAFYSHLDRSWTPNDETSKYPGMVARHVFSYAAAYLMGGDKRHLRIAREAVDFMIEHGWDEEHGGWYNEVSRTGEVVDSSKGLFMQIYAITGLALYAIVTHDDEAEDYMRRTHQLLEQHAWDEGHGGYVRGLNRDLSFDATHKDFTPQFAPLSGYLLYLYPATRDSTYLREAERIMEVALNRMKSDDGWIFERFDRDWTFLPDDPKNSHINVGHNVETAWLLLRLHALTGADAYREEALRLTEQLHRYAFDAETGAWYQELRREDPSEHASEASWWMQAYGNMFELYLYRSTGAEAHLDHFRQGARFWNEHFVDDAHGGTVLKVALDGEVTSGAKAVRSKTSYHAMEHALLNYLYLNLWVNDEPVELYYRVDNPKERRLYPLPIEDRTVRIQSVELNGEPWTAIDRDEGFIRLPDAPASVRVVLTNPPASP